MKFAEVYARLGPDVPAIAEALGITQPEADTLINLHMETKHQRKTAVKVSATRPGKVRYAGYDRSAHLLGESGDVREW